MERLGTVFIRSANEHSGTKERFLKKLEVLRQLTKDGVFSFGAEAMEAYLYSYREAGYHPVSHSHTYREAYHPAYRVVLSRLWE